MPYPVSVLSYRVRQILLVYFRNLKICEFNVRVITIKDVEVILFYYSLFFNECLRFLSSVDFVSGSIYVLKIIINIRTG